MNRPRTLLRYALLLSLGGCGASAPAGTTASRVVTSVTWDAAHRPIVAARKMEVSADAVSSDSACGSNDLVLSDKPLVPSPVDLSYGEAGLIDPTSNVLCLTDPGDIESVSLALFPYPVGVAQTWAHHVVSYLSAGQRGGFFNNGQDPGITAFAIRFGSNEAQDLSASYRTANGVDFDVWTLNPPCLDSSPNSEVQCVGTVLQHCDGWGQWQTSIDCASLGAGHTCDAAKLTCDCPPPTCGAGSCGDKVSACGTSVDCGECQGFDQSCVRNRCQVVACHCAKGFMCDPDGACIRS